MLALQRAALCCPGSLVRSLWLWAPFGCFVLGKEWLFLFLMVDFGWYVALCWDFSGVDVVLGCSDLCSSGGPMGSDESGWSFLGWWPRVLPLRLVYSAFSIEVLQCGPVAGWLGICALFLVAVSGAGRTGVRMARVMAGAGSGVELGAI